MLKINVIQSPPQEEASLGPTLDRVILRAIQAHGERWVRESEELEARKRAKGIPYYVDEFVNKTPAIDMAAYAACPVDTDDVWVWLRKMVLMARVGVKEVPSYRAELYLILRVLHEPVHGVRDGLSLFEINEHASAEDISALAWEIWRECPASVSPVPFKSPYTMREGWDNLTEAECQVFLTDGPEPIGAWEVGICYSNELRWHIGTVRRNGFQSAGPPIDEAETKV